MLTRNEALAIYSLVQWGSRIGCAARRSPITRRARHPGAHRSVAILLIL